MFSYKTLLTCIHFTVTFLELSISTCPRNSAHKMHVAGSSGVLVAAKLHHGHATSSGDIQNGRLLSGQPSLIICSGAYNHGVTYCKLLFQALLDKHLVHTARVLLQTNSLTSTCSLAQCEMAWKYYKVFVPQLA